jgi:hypothetical protein
MKSFTYRCGHTFYAPTDMSGFKIEQLKARYPRMKSRPDCPACEHAKAEKVVVEVQEFIDKPHNFTDEAALKIMKGGA